MVTELNNLQMDTEVDFLRREGSYPEGTTCVEVKETHMSWVFLTDRFAYKLKKPVRYAYLDFSTLQARHEDSLKEVRLNRRLAHNVYHGVVPLTIDRSGAMRLGGDGAPIDWMVKMRRLPAEKMLDRAIENGTAEEQDIRRVAARLTGFYDRSPPFPISASDYRSRLESGLEECRRELLSPQYGQVPSSVHQVHDAAQDLLDADAAALDSRVHEGHVIDAHGDLRPEHICLEHEPVIIDCLQFNQDFRILDTASELSFLTLECERLGAADVPRIVWEIYRASTEDHPPATLVAFYRAFHACVRAKLAAWHLKDDDVREPDKWRNRARDYLQRAAESLRDC